MSPVTAKRAPKATRFTPAGRSARAVPAGASAIVLVKMHTAPVQVAAQLPGDVVVLGARHLQAACRLMAEAAPAAVIASRALSSWDARILDDHLPANSKLRFEDPSLDAASIVRVLEETSRGPARLVDEDLAISQRRADARDAGSHDAEPPLLRTASELAQALLVPTPRAVIVGSRRRSPSGSGAEVFYFARAGSVTLSISHSELVRLIDAGALRQR